jgi:hypothetical protein
MHCGMSAPSFHQVRLLTEPHSAMRYGVLLHLRCRLSSHFGHR